MNFFDLRGIFLTQIATEKGKYELDANNISYPTYSEAALDKMLLDYMNNQGYNVDKLGAYKKLGTESYNIGQEWYEQVIGKKVDINSVSALKKMYADLISIWNNMKFVFEVHQDTPDATILFNSEYLDYIEYHIDWGDGTVENTSDVQIEHSYATTDVYKITITVNKIKDYQNDAFTSPTEIPFTLNPDEATLKCIYANYWAPFVLSNKNGTTAYIATTINGEEVGYINKLAALVSVSEMRFGDSTLPYFNPQDGISNYTTSQPDQLYKVYIQTVGTDFTDADQNYTRLTTLKVAPDDLNTFKTAVTAFNTGNTTATLTVLKGKNQEEAYQWATANGHFASIVKE